LAGDAVARGLAILSSDRTPTRIEAHSVVAHGYVANNTTPGLWFYTTECGASGSTGVRRTVAEALAELIESLDTLAGPSIYFSQSAPVEVPASQWLTCRRAALLHGWEPRGHPVRGYDLKRMLHALRGAASDAMTPVPAKIHVRSLLAASGEDPVEIA
jgi:hypothetical protein